MVKEMRFESNPFFLAKHKDILIKIFSLFFLMALIFSIFFSDSSSSSSFSSLSEKIVDPPQNSPFLQHLPENNNSQTALSQNDDTERCDIFVGDWIPDPTGPAYTNESCNVIESHQNCMKNGRPDSGYLHWRWSPRDCKLPRFNSMKFLDLMRNKSWAFIGDSIQRNHVQSLLCILSQVEQAVEIYHDEAYRSKKWHFSSHNFTLSVIWAPFLTKAVISEDVNGVSSSDIQLHLDELEEEWTTQYKDFDYAVIAFGKWYLKTSIYYENDTVTGCHYCPGRNVTDLGFQYAYRKAIKLVFDFITASDHKAFVFFRTTTPDHFEDGEWFNGGSCYRKVPFKNGEIEIKDIDSAMRDIELEEFDKVVASGKISSFKLLDTTRLATLRPDGHPGPYRLFHPGPKVDHDCLHWCLPGPIDSWNDLLMEVLVRDEKSR